MAKAKTLEDVRKAKAQLESDIMALLDDFTKLTSLTVTGIEIHLFEDGILNNDYLSVTTKVEI